MTKLSDLLDARGVLLVDGAMGTELFARGLTAGDPPEMWNVDMADDVADIHRGYIKAGSDIILTNSFGGTGFRLALHGLDDRVVELNTAAARLARQAADAADRVVLVAGSLGPTGELLSPMGDMSPQQARRAFAEQATGLAAGGVDLLWVETMSSLEEVEAAVLGARDVCDLPIAATMSFDTAGRTMMGVTGSDAALRLGSFDLAAIGANCGNNIAETEAAVIEIHAAARDIPVIAKANAGIPEFVGDRLHYTGTPEVMGAHVRRMTDAGVSIIGGCCGTSTQHVAFMRAVLDGDIVAPDVAPPGRAGGDATTGRTRPARRRRRRTGQNR